MRKVDIHSVKDCCSICECGDYVVATGKSLWIFRRDGSFVAKSLTIRYPYKIAFILPDRLFVEGGSDHQYHYVSLVNGEDIWNCPIDRKRTSSPRRFAISPDGKIVYDMYKVNGKLYAVRISLDDCTIDRAAISEQLRVTCNLFTDEEGVLYALQTQRLPEDQRISQNGILKIDWREQEPLLSWKCLWQSEGNAFVRDTDGRYVLHEDYSVLDLETMENFSLLKNDSSWKPTQGFTECTYIAEKDLLIAYHFLYDGNVVIDCKTRKRVAQYIQVQPPMGYGYKGCLIDGEYWIGTEEGIVRFPFPVFGEMPEMLSPYWLFTKEMEKVRGEQLDHKLSGT